MDGRWRRLCLWLWRAIALSMIAWLTACGAVAEQVIPTLRPTHTPTLEPSATFTRVFNATPTITPTPVQVVAASTSGPTVTPLIGEVPTRPRYTLTPTELFIDPGALRIEYFTTSTTALKPGDRLTLFWSVKGVEKAVIYRLDASGKREQLWNVGRAGSLEVETRPTDRDVVQFLLYAGDDKSHVEQTIAIPLKCTEPWFFEPAPDGCPASPATITAEVQQPFERGLMIWVQSQSRIYVLFNDNQKPAWTFFPDEFKDGQPESDPALSPPAGMLQPIRGFGLVWRSHGAVKQRLGWATARETPFDGAFQGDADSDSVMYLRDKDGTILALADKGASWKLIRP